MIVFKKFVGVSMIGASLQATLLAQSSNVLPYTFITLAGSAGYGIADGSGRAARFYQPSGLVVDSQTNFYVGDYQNHTIRKVTRNGAVTTFAGMPGNRGTNDGIGSAARFNYPSGVAVDSSDNIYVADTFNQTIRKVTPAGMVTTLAGAPGTASTNDGSGINAQFNYPVGVAVDKTGNVYVADSESHTVRRITAQGVVSTVAGLAGVLGTVDGTGGAARFFYPHGVAVDSAGNVYVADRESSAIRLLSPSGVVTTLAGRFIGSLDGTGSAARFYYPSGVALNSAGTVYVADTDNHTIRVLIPAGTNSTVITLAGSPGNSGNDDGTGSDARFYYPHSVAVDPAGNIYVADLGNSTIRKVTPTGTVTTLAGPGGGSGSLDGTGDTARFSRPSSLAVEVAGDLLVADSQNNAIRKVMANGVVETMAGLAGQWGNVDGTGSDARFNDPNGIAVDPISGNAYVSDTGNNTIRKVTTSGVVTTLAGLAGSHGSTNGTGSDARFYYPFGLTVDSSGYLYVADSQNHTIRKVSPAGVVTTVAGIAGTYGTNDGPASSARFRLPWDVAVDNAGTLYVADRNNHTIRKIQGGLVTTLAGLAGVSGTNDGAGSAARFAYPRGVCVDSASNVFVADGNNQAIRRVTTDGVVTTVAGVAGDFTFGSVDGTGSAARFYYPNAVKVDSSGNLYVADYENNTIRKGIPGSSFPSPALGPPTLSAGQFDFTVIGPPGLPVIIESSRTLLNWQFAGTYVLNGASNQFLSPTPVEDTRFYRARIR